MFHSKHPAALLHATARVVSGSGIYVSDKPGAHDIELLQRLVLPNGSVLRPHLPGRPTKDILFADVLKDNKTLLKARYLLSLLVCCLGACCISILYKFGFMCSWMLGCPLKSDTSLHRRNAVCVSRSRLSHGVHSKVARCLLVLHSVLIC